MRVSILTQVFPPELHPTAVMVDQLARHVVAQGHEVEVSAGYPHHPHGRILGGYSKRLLTRERRDGVTVRRAWHVTSERRGILSRAMVMTSQALSTGVAAHRSARPDVVVSYGPPLIGPLVASTVAGRHRVPLLTVVYDIYPDIAIETGKVTNPVAVAAARAAERLVYRRSDRILVLSDGFKATLEAKGVPSERIVVVPVWLDPDEIVPADRDNAWRREHGIAPGTFVVLYAGTVGLVSGAEIMLEAAAQLRDDPAVLILFVGDGQIRPLLEARAKERSLANVRFIDFQPRERLREVQATSDVSVVTLAAGRGRTSVPSKVTGYMAAGRPVVASVDPDSDTARCIQRARCGVIVPAGDGAALANAIRHLRASSEAREVMGSAARMGFESEFAAPAVLERYLHVLVDLAGGRA